MSNQTRRTVLAMGIGAVVAGGAGYMALAGSGQTGFEHVFMTGEAIRAAEADALVIDIRTPPEWAQTGVIEGAELIEFDFNNPNSFLPKIQSQISDGRDIIMYCRTGNRTQAVADFLSKQIPNRIISVKGGIMKVLAEGYKPVAPS